MTVPMQGSVSVRATPERVAAALTDPEVMRHLLPDVESLELQADGSHALSIARQVGPVMVRLRGSLAVQPTDDPATYRLQALAKAPFGGRADLQLNLTLRPEGAVTHLGYDGTVELGGIVRHVISGREHLLTDRLAARLRVFALRVEAAQG